MGLHWIKQEHYYNDPNHMDKMDNKMDRRTVAIAATTTSASGFPTTATSASNTTSTPITGTNNTYGYELVLFKV